MSSSALHASTLVLEDTLFREGSWARLWDLITQALDCYGVHCHREELSSRTYQVLRHCLYSCVMSHIIIFALVVLCYTSGKDPEWVISLGLWAAVISVGVVHYAICRLVGPLYAWLHRCIDRHGMAGTVQTSRCKDLHHVLAIQGISLVVYIVLHVLIWSKTQKLRASTAAYIAFSIIVFLCYSKKYATSLWELERTAARNERRAFQARMSSNVLTFADILAGRRHAITEEQTQSILYDQPVVVYDPDAFGEFPECCICASEFDACTEIRHLQCGHFFHSHCLRDWLPRSLTCPLCREDLGQQYIHNEARRLELQLGQIVGAIPPLV